MKYLLLLLLVVNSYCYSAAKLGANQKGVSKGQYADLLIYKYDKYDGVKLENKKKFNIVCHWGIDGHQFVSYLVPNKQSNELYYDNNDYKFFNVSWRCQRDIKNTHAKGTFKKYANKYIR